MTDVRQALRREFESRGFDVASDTIASRAELYIRGEDDLAVAIFEFKADAREAFETMYQGRWTEGLPPRFAVLPARAVSEPDFELLEQVGITPLLFEVADETIAFVELDEVLGRLPR